MKIAYFQFFLIASQRSDLVILCGGLGPTGGRPKQTLAKFPLGKEPGFLMRRLAKTG